MDTFTENMKSIPTNRIEALSDGVIAIIITVMIFDLKIQSLTKEEMVWEELMMLTPKFVSYALSFLSLSIMWVNHHQLFHQIRNTDGRLLWYNIHLLFWMSMVPFGTNFIGSNPFLWQASLVYGIIFFMNAQSFTLLRKYVVEKELLYEGISRKAHLRIRNKNRLAQGLYLLAGISAVFSVYISFMIFVIIPAMYFTPEKIIHQTAE